MSGTGEVTGATVEEPGGREKGRGGGGDHIRFSPCTIPEMVGLEMKGK